jgi:competence protein ComEA
MTTRIALAAVAVLAIAIFAFRHPTPQATVQPLSDGAANASPTTPYDGEPRRRYSRLPAPANDLVVYVAGAVKRPGLYHLRYGDRYERAVDLAGGLQTSADPAGIDLAQRAGDGEEIYVPPAGETSHVRERRPSHRRRAAATPPNGSVDVNSADAAELAAVPGIGRAVAARIVELREREGSFASLDELLDVAGMTQTRLERARPYLRNI